ncbi:hypothetical protein [Lactobacillus terrae]|uniref:hypothetical protein n=1 Tax=Lactobacillus terrae TaxID=2269374 RepID=UPI0010FD91F8|nr:hypothetical protein [Lactobacillus terrae]
MKEINRARDLRKAGSTYAQIAQKLTDEFDRPFTQDSVSSMLRREGLRDDVTETLTAEDREWNSDHVQTSETIINVIDNECKTPEDILIAHGYDPKLWKISNGTSNFWKQSEGTTSFQSKISVKPSDELTAKDFAELFKGDIKPLKFNKLHGRTSKRNLVIPLADIHLGWTKLSDITDMLDNINDVIQSKTYDTIVIEQLGDLFHSDQINTSTTVSGTLLDNADMRQGIKDALEMFDIILGTAFKHAKHVQLKTVFGNHSGDIEYVFLYAMRERYPQLDIEFNDNNPATDWRMCYMLGRVSIMLSHGSYGTKNLIGLYPVEYKDEWYLGSTHELHTGHYHTERFRDVNGITWRQLGTPKPNDPYEIKNGYTTSKKVMYLFEYDEERLRVTYEI